VDMERVGRQATLKARLLLLADRPGFHQAEVEEVDLGALERLIEGLEKVLSGERVAVRVTPAPPISQPGRQRGFRAKPDGEDEAGEEG
jgi:hypothetical protein